MPCVVVWPTPKGLPMASTTSPTRGARLSAKVATGSSPSLPASLSTARSVSGSAPTTLAAAWRPSARATSMASAASTT
ncbi:Uncharacterised protein [Bordetella pertussis]|nr:Uncharacterised protein [Bordetella pertussis]CFW20592.1 Uncharacterised protein [Bordetella pertussis]